MALRFDGELYMVESQDGWYWPHKHIQRTKFADWVEYAHNADFHIVHLPLSDAAKARFDEKKSNEFFWKTQGHIYGYHNFIWGWIDTAEQNFPPLLAAPLLPILMNVLEQLDKNQVYVTYGSGLNKRLGTDNLGVEEIIAEAARRNLTLGDLYQMKEVDGWLYHGAGPLDGFNYVCSSYVVGHYIAAGIFEGYGE
eukprot:NODE_367_length_1841_cov_75.886719_g309_i0.p1 GENE.NODE_367_length_1841_cov_75.886719_g309_i0~~NODE_367_length_1841_cov_75.886719_g309_i0.p1  ORF type:complete len:195 (-),score=44.69 NODE_367_length_1841_cov_75.886719_g309_i0:291-875(-)